MKNLEHSPVKFPDLRANLIQYGLKLTDSDYQQKPEWEDILFSAKKLYQELLKNNSF